MEPNPLTERRAYDRAQFACVSVERFPETRKVVVTIPGKQQTFGGKGETERLVEYQLEMTTVPSNRGFPATNEYGIFVIEIRTTDLGPA